MGWPAFHEPRNRCSTSAPASWKSSTIHSASCWHRADEDERGWTRESPVALFVIVAVPKVAERAWTVSVTVSPAEKLRLKADLMKLQLALIEREFQRRREPLPDKRMGDTLKGAGMATLKIGLKSGLFKKAYKDLKSRDLRDEVCDASIDNY